MRYREPSSGPKIPRPSNPFFLFRSDLWESEGKNGLHGRHQNKFSQRAGERWRKLDPEIKAEYVNKAKAVKEAHGHQHPGYNYRPKHKKMKVEDVAGEGEQIHLLPCPGESEFYAQ